MKRNLIFSGALLLISGCASVGGESTIAASWRGAHIDEAFKQWGIPRAQAKLGDGTGLYEWTEDATYSLHTTTTGTVSAQEGNASFNAITSPGSISGQCVRRLTTDATGVIVDYHYKGNDCCVAAIAGYCKSLIKRPN